MIYFLHRQIPENQKVSKVLSNIAGLNLTRINFILRRLGVKPAIFFNELSKVQIRSLNFLLKRLFLIDRNLNKVLRFGLSEFLKSGHYKALRMKQGLPARGQRTHTNAGTARRMRDVRQRNLKKKI